MNELIQGYYLGERATALQGLAVGVMLVLASWLLWRFAVGGSIARGAACALLAYGILQAVASGGYLMVLSGRADNAAAIAAGDEAAQREREIARMEALLRGTSYVGTQAVLSALIMVGLVLTLTMHAQPVAVGIGLGLMLAGVLGHAFEAQSIQKNRQHLAAVEAYAAPEQRPVSD